MSTWKHISKEVIEVPIRSAGNTVHNQHILFDVYKDGTMYKAVPDCSEEQKILANLKPEILFSFRQNRAIADGGISDGNQHIAERVGMLLLKNNGTADAISAFD